MENITLIGVAHGEGIQGALCGPSSEKLFVEHFFPSLAEMNTLLIVEGHLDKIIITPDNPRYEHAIAHISIALAASDLGPDIFGGDTRLKSMRDIGRMYGVKESIETWLRNTGANFMAKKFETLDEIEQCVISGKQEFLFDFPSTPPLFIKQCAQKQQLEYQRMEQYMVMKAKALSKDYEQVLVITGLNHTLRMVQTSGLRYKILQEIKNSEEAMELYTQIIQGTQIPKIIANM